MPSAVTECCKGTLARRLGHGVLSVFDSGTSELVWQATKLDTSIPGTGHRCLSDAATDGKIIVVSAGPKGKNAPLSAYALP